MHLKSIYSSNVTRVISRNYISPQFSLLSLSLSVLQNAFEFTSKSSCVQWEHHSMQTSIYIMETINGMVTRVISRNYISPQFSLLSLSLSVLQNAFEFTSKSSCVQWEHHSMQTSIYIMETINGMVLGKLQVAPVKTALKAGFSNQSSNVSLSVFQF
ncbi:hypothetical protein EGR_08258 [Echinococcus granulosus]|uniref:Uncharacterized protein n=1 Tax=Echinococcus granulosus TaxID=6210 RepID=W6U8U8_ECHGR|nr:hypothetical protein EGR_08258 [Echinococcus granulosus]EUB56906.1 hypothetical protein EGR_08258 [Echinococcus granulosus]